MPKFIGKLAEQTSANATVADHEEGLMHEGPVALYAVPGVRQLR